MRNVTALTDPYAAALAAASWIPTRLRRSANTASGRSADSTMPIAIATSASRPKPLCAIFTPPVKPIAHSRYSDINFVTACGTRRFERTSVAIMPSTKKRTGGLIEKAGRSIWGKKVATFARKRIPRPRERKRPKKSPK